MECALLLLCQLRRSHAEEVSDALALFLSFEHLELGRLLSSRDLVLLKLVGNLADE